MPSEDLRQLFRNKFDCYADTTDESVVLAMTEDRFVETLEDTPVKFTKKFPSQDGHYYFVDIEYPIPRLAFFYKRGRDCFIQEIGKVDSRLEDYHFRQYRFGPAVPMPECKNIKYDS